MHCKLIASTIEVVGKISGMPVDNVPGRVGFSNAKLKTRVTSRACTIAALLTVSRTVTNRPAKTGPFDRS